MPFYHFDLINTRTVSEAGGADLLGLGQELLQAPPVGVYVGLAVLVCGLAVVTAARREVPATAPPD